MAYAVHCDARAPVRTTSSEIRRVDQRCHGGIHLGHKGIERSTPSRHLQGILGREICGTGGPSHVGISLAIDGKARIIIITNTTRVRREENRRVNDRRPASIIGAEMKANTCCTLQDITAGNLLPRTADFLIDLRLLSGKTAQVKWLKHLIQVVQSTRCDINAARDALLLFKHALSLILSCIFHLKTVGERDEMPPRASVRWLEAHLFDC